MSPEFAAHLKTLSGIGLEDELSRRLTRVTAITCAGSIACADDDGNPDLCADIVRDLFVACHEDLVECRAILSEINARPRASRTATPLRSV